MWTRTPPVTYVQSLTNNEHSYLGVCKCVHNWGNENVGVLVKSQYCTGHRYFCKPQRLCLLLFQTNFFVMFCYANGKSVLKLRCKKTGEQDVKNFIGMGCVEAEELTAEYRSIMPLAFCQDLCFNFYMFICLNSNTIIQSPIWIWSLRTSEFNAQDYIPAPPKNVEAKGFFHAEYLNEAPYWW